MPFRIIRDTTVGPVADIVVKPDAGAYTAQNLREYYDNALENAAKQGCGSIAFKDSTSVEYNASGTSGIDIAVAAFTDFLENNDMDIILVVSDDKDEKISGELFGEVREYVDESRKPAPVKPARSFLSRIGAPRSKKQHAESDKMGAAPLSAPLPSLCPEPQEEKPLDDIIKGIYKESFEKHLQMLINKKGLKNSEVYAAANISKQYFSKLLKGQVKPSKEKVLALAVGLRLNIDETIDFLSFAGYALSPISQTDTIVKYFIIHEDDSVIKIDIVLYDYGLDPLS